MPRLLKRYQDNGSDHFVTFSCYHRLPYLDDGLIRTAFLDRLEWLRQQHDFYVFGYVLMPEHVHLLVSEPKRYKLSRTINVLKAEVSKQIRGTKKQFWQSATGRNLLQLCRQFETRKVPIGYKCAAPIAPERPLQGTVGVRTLCGSYFRS